MKKLYILVFVSIILSGCGGPRLTVYAPVHFNKSEKTITIKSGTNLNRALKIEFRRAGWKVKNDSTYITTKGSYNDNIHLTTKQESITKYRIETKSRDGICTCDCGAYNIALIDNTTGEEIVTLDEGMAAASCYSTPAKKLTEWIKQHEK